MRYKITNDYYEKIYILTTIIIQIISNNLNEKMKKKLKILLVQIHFINDYLHPAFTKQYQSLSHN